MTLITNSPMIGLYRGKSLVSKLIKFQTRGMYSHVGIHFGNEVIEAWATNPLLLKGGVYHRPVGEGHNRNTPIDMFTFEYDESKLAEANLFLLAQVGKKYDYRMVSGFLTRKKHQGKAASNKWFCSELAYVYLQKLGVPLFARSLAYEISPDMMKRLPALTYSHTLVTK